MNVKTMVILFIDIIGIIRYDCFLQNKQSTKHYALKF
jgi:hypothetical protein